MTLQASGAISLQEICDEFAGGSPTGLASLYLGGASNLVRATAGNANAGVVNGAAGIPSSGPISFKDFYSKSRLLSYDSPGAGSIIYLANIFGDNWGHDYPKKFINSGVQARLYVSASGAGDITVVNNSEIQGLGGAAGTGGGGGNGTPALYCYSTCTVENNGAIRGGGGGGGRGGVGGTGGAGFYYNTVREPSSGEYFQFNWQWSVSAGSGSFSWNGSLVGYVSASQTSSAVGGYIYYRGSLQGVGYDPETGNPTDYSYGIYRTYQQTINTSGGAGGAGGAGGRGRGYGQTSTNGAGGSAGAAGGTNAGTGGTGGTGGNGGGWGADGANGATGATGNSGNGGSGSSGSAGSSGGNAGEAIIGSGYTLSPAGTLNGAY